MALFGKKNKQESTCDCGCNCSQQTDQTLHQDAAIKVLGSGCAKCNQLEAATKEALIELGLNTAIDHVTDFAQIASYGVMSTPALVVDGKVVSYGKVLKKDEVIDLIKNVRS